MVDTTTRNMPTAALQQFAATRTSQYLGLGMCEQNASSHLESIATMANGQGVHANESILACSCGVLPQSILQPIMSNDQGANQW